MWRWLRFVGWGLLTLAVIGLTVIVIVGALRAHSDAEFNRWVGWATVAAVPLAALGVLLVLWEKLTESRATPKLDVREIEDQLAVVVLAEAGQARSRLIGTDQAGDHAANVRFMKPGRFREVGGTSEGDLNSVLGYYQSLSPRRLVVLGDPGAGKTVLVIELQVQLLECRPHDADTPVPVLISASAYDIGKAWDEWLTQHLALRYSISLSAVASLIRNRRILPIIDGLDEMDSSGQIKRASALVTALNTSMQGRERAPVIVTCRRTQYQHLVREVDRATHIEMLPLTSDEAAGYLRDQFLRPEEKQRWEPVLAALRQYPYGTLAAQLTTPWRLTLALAAFRDGGDPAMLLPPTPDLADAAFTGYAQQVDSLLLGRYMASAIVLYPPPRQVVGNVQQWLTSLAGDLNWQAHHEGSATDLELYTWWRPVGRRVTSLVHAIILTAIAAPWVAVAAVRRDFGMAIFCGALLFLSVAAGLPPTPRRLNVRQLVTRSGLRRIVSYFPFTLVIGIIFGLSVGLVLGLKRGLLFAVIIGLILGLATGLVSGFLNGVENAIDDAAPQAIGPQEIIRSDGYFGLVSGSMYGFVAGLMSWIAWGPIIGLAAGASFGLILGLGYSGDVWARYQIAVVVAAARRHGPLSFGASLDWARQAGLLRISGVAYQFRHRQLQDWLTSH